MDSVPLEKIKLQLRESLTGFLDELDHQCESKEQLLQTLRLAHQRQCAIVMPGYLVTYQPNSEAGMHPQEAEETKEQLSGFEQNQKICAKMDDLSVAIIAKAKETEVKAQELILTQVQMSQMLDALKAQNSSAVDQLQVAYDALTEEIKGKTDQQEDHFQLKNDLFKEILA